jgi:GTPase
LVEGAHRNEGLGFSFLRHIVRCECILYVLDITNGPLECLKEQWEALRNELNAYENDLMKKESAIVINKIDTIQEENRVNIFINIQIDQIFVL